MGQSPQSQHYLLVAIRPPGGKLHAVYRALARKGSCTAEHGCYGIPSEPVMVVHVFVTQADCQHPLGHYGEYGVGDVTGVSMINEALGEPPDNSKTVFGFAKQGNAAVGTYFVRVEFSNTLRVLLEPGLFVDVSRVLKGRNSICSVLHCVLMRPLFSCVLSYCNYLL